MYDPTPFTLIPAIGEPDHDARFREELANEREAAATEGAVEVASTVDVETLLAGHLRRAATFVRFG
jgi:hypothetical protein